MPQGQGGREVKPGERLVFREGRWWEVQLANWSGARAFPFSLVLCAHTRPWTTHLSVCPGAYSHQRKAQGNICVSVFFL